MNYAQVGIGTTNPQGALDVTSTNTAFIAPRVTNIEDVTNGAGGDAPNGAIVYDESRNKTCYKIDNKWVCIGIDENGNVTSSVDIPLETQDMTYVKASNTNSSDNFGISVSISNDGSRLAVGASGERSNATGINGDQTNNLATNSGAVYIFSRSGTTWVQEAYIKASNTGSNDRFGSRLSISSDGSRLAVSASGEDSNATGINGDQTNNLAASSGAVYVFSRSGTTWVQEAYIKASNTEASDFFRSLSISSDGSRLAVGASGEDSNATGINGDQTNNLASGSGAVYIFSRSGTTWIQEAYIKASNTEAGDVFGSPSISSDGSRLAVGALSEDSNATGINGDETNNTASFSGAVYVFSRSGTTWVQEAYIKASNTETGDRFSRVSISSDGSRLAVGASFEGSNATGINGDQTNNLAAQSGAVYVFSRSGTTWVQEAYIKASNTDLGDRFGNSVSISSDGTKLVVDALPEDSVFRGINANQNDNTASNSGAVYVFGFSGGLWSQSTYIKSSNSETGDFFSNSVSLSGNGLFLSAGANLEDSNTTGIGGDQNDNTASNSGAVYVINPL